jgi:hypothetical protein
MTGPPDGQPRKPNYDFRQKDKAFSLCHLVQSGLGPTQSLIQWVTYVLYLGAKRLRRYVDHSLPSIAELRVHGALPPIFLMSLCSVNCFICKFYLLFDYIHVF